MVDNAGKLVGIISEGDLIHRSETGTERRYRWWMRLVGGDASLAADYIKTHTRKAADIMTQRVITAAPEIELDEVAILLERNAIKRVPIVRDDQLGHTYLADNSQLDRRGTTCTRQGVPCPTEISAMPNCPRVQAFVMR